MERKQFTFYASFYEAVMMIPRAAERCRVLESICRYALYGVEVDPETLGPKGGMAWKLVHPFLETGRRKAAGGMKSPKDGMEDVDKIQASYEEDVDNKNKVKDKVKRKDKEKNKDKCPVPGGWEVLQAYRDKVNPQPSPRCREELEQFVGRVGPEVCLRAIDEAVDEGKAGWAYIRGILRSKAEQGVRSLADWDALEARRSRGRAGTGGGRHQVGCVPGQISRGPDRQALEDMERMRKAMERMKKEELEHGQEGE